MKMYASVSLYVPPTMEIWQAVTYLKNEQDRIKNVRDATTRRILLRELNLMIVELDKIAKNSQSDYPPQRGIVLFCNPQRKVIAKKPTYLIETDFRTIEKNPDIDRISEFHFDISDELHTEYLTLAAKSKPIAALAK